MGLFLKNVEDLRRVEWAKSWHWDIKFPNAPAPFKQWFPATTVEENLATVNVHNFSAGFSSYDIPKSSEAFNLSVTFADSAWLVLLRWLDHWMNDIILGDGNYIATLSECVEQVIIVKLGPKNVLVSQNEYLVFPSGSLNYPGSSTAEIATTTVEFKIASILSKKYF